MAKIEKPQAPGLMIRELAPKGNWIATCVKVEDRYGVERDKYGKPGERETVDLCQFYFGLFAKDGKPYLIRSKAMKISGHENSALYEFLLSWLGDVPFGGDTQDLVGKGAQIAVIHQDFQGKTYANIQSIAPVMEQLEAAIRPVADFDSLLEHKEEEAPF